MGLKKQYPALCCLKEAHLKCEQRNRSKVKAYNYISYNHKSIENWSGYINIKVGPYNNLDA